MSSCEIAGPVRPLSADEDGSYLVPRRRWHGDLAGDELTCDDDRLLHPGRSHAYLYWPRGSLSQSG